MDTETRKLGKNQVEFMSLLRQHRGTWHREASWSWKAPSETLRMLAPLLNRGFVSYNSETARFQLTRAGRDALREAEASGLGAPDLKAHERRHAA